MQGTNHAIAIGLPFRLHSQSTRIYINKQREGKGPSRIHRLLVRRLFPQSCEKEKVPVESSFTSAQKTLPSSCLCLCPNHADHVGSAHGEPPAKQRNIDPIARTDHPWDLPATVPLPHRCDCPGRRFGHSREANLPIDREANRVVARVSQAVVGVASITVYGDQLWSASGFIVEFDESSMIGTIFSCASVSEHIPMFPKIDEIRVYLFDGTSYDATIEACDNHWNLLVLSVSFGRAVKTMNMVDISENRNAMDVHRQGFVLQSHSASERLCPGDTIIGLGRQSTKSFGLQANCGVYSYDRWADLPRFCHEMQKATFINTYTSIGGPAINKNGGVIGMLFHDLDCTPFMPSNIILKWWGHFKKTRTYCRPTMRVFGVNLHNAQSSPWVEVPTSLYESYEDGFLVERVPRSVRSAGLQEKDLIIRCNGKPVATSLQLFEILAENIGKMVEVTFVKAEDNSTHSIYLPVEETLEKNFYSWPIAQYH